MTTWRWLYLGDLLASQGRFEEAERAYRVGISRDPELAWIWKGLGDLLHDKLHRFAEAEHAYLQAIARDPGNPWAWSDLGRLLQNQFDRFDEAEAAFRRALELNPTFDWTWLSLGTLLENQFERFADAEKAYREALVWTPDNSLLWIALARVLHQHLHRFAEAESAYLKAIALNRSSTMAWNGLGNLYCDQMNRLSDAADAYENALRIDPHDETANHNIIFLRRDFMGEGSGARPLMDALKDVPNAQHPDVTHLHEALFAAYEHNWGLARESLSQALTLRAEGFDPSTNEGWLRASAVLLHLNYGRELLDLLNERGDTQRLRPWVEALRALHAGDRRLLQNIAPEIRVTAEVFYDGIESRLNKLPEKTRRRVVTTPKPRRRRSR